MQLRRLVEAIRDRFPIQVKTFGVKETRAIWCQLRWIPSHHFRSVEIDRNAYRVPSCLEQFFLVN